MGLISGLITQGAIGLFNNSKVKNSLLQTIEIVEKHRRFLASKGTQNIEVEEFIKKNSKIYNKNLKKL